MDLRSLLINNNSEIQEFTQTYQYKASRKLMRMRYEISYSVAEMANALDISFEKYVSLEYGDANITYEEYAGILKQARKFVDLLLIKSIPTSEQYRMIFVENEFIVNTNNNVKADTSDIELPPSESIKGNNQISLAA